jgi:alkylation response protein AidB-like acyl-CoA dehydrogenase
MGFLPSAEQDELAVGVRRFLADQLPLSKVRALIGAGTAFDAQVWSMLAGRLELLGLAVPAEFGGSGGGYRDQAQVAEEFGAALSCLPYLSTVGLVLPLLGAADETSRTRWLPGVVDGTVRAALAVADAGAVEDDWRRYETATEARATDACVTLHGAKTFVLDGAAADVLFVSARTAEGTRVFAVDPSVGGVVRHRLTTLDPTRPMAEVILDGCAAEPVGVAGTALASIQDVAQVILAMEQVGAARRCLEMSIDYARTRVQFGRKIGAFQAIKHRCADMFVALESARVAALHAAWAADMAPGELQVAAAAAKALASEALLFCAKQNIQIHGGIGVTAEHDAHLYYRRAQSTNLLFGSPTALRERLADELQLAPGGAR